MDEQRWESADLLLRQVENGILVCQGSSSYLARGWFLGAAVKGFVDTCLAAGFQCAIRYSHPKPSNRQRGVDYIGFSRSPTERIVCVIDQYGPKTLSDADQLRRVIFEKHYRFVLESAGVNWKWQSSSARNIEVPAEELQAALLACKENVEAVESAIGARAWEETKAKIGFVTEAVLEDWMIRSWRNLNFGAPLSFVANQVCHCDILARVTDAETYVVFELKRGPVDSRVLEQLESYLHGRLRETVIGSHKDVWGAVVAQSFDERCVDAAKRKDYPIALFIFTEGSTGIGLEHVFSNWPISDR